MAQALVSLTTEIPPDVDRAKVELLMCDGEHRCHSDPIELPTRLLDLGSGSTLRLLETSPAGPDKIKGHRYAALSYCWGSNPAFTTTSSTINERKSGFDESLLPLTLLESVRVVRHLGLRYLWIDALCIIQGDDSEAKADWKTESDRRCLVYEGAYVTIVAAGSSDSRGGLIGGRPSCTIRGRELGDSIAPVLTLNTMGADIPLHKGAIFSRAWAFQEWYLSPRVLVFTGTRLHLVCQEDQVLENLAKHASFRIRLPKTLEEFKPRNWYVFVANYTARNLSDPADKLPAIAGLARKFSDVGANTLGRYCAGLWENTILDGILWKRAQSDEPTSNILPMVFKRGRCLIKPDDATDNRKEPQPRAPSWSWAAVDGPILFVPRQAYCKVQHLTCDVKLANSNSPFGRVDSGVLTITCPFAMGSLIVKHGGLFVKANGGTSGFWGDDPSEIGELLESPDRGKSKLHLLCIEDNGAAWYGIAVVPNLSSVGSYFRVGQFALVGARRCVLNKIKKFRIL